MEKEGVMPKEMIRPASDNDPFVLVVKWAAPGSPGMMQIGVETRDNKHLLWQLLEERLADIASAMRGLVHDEDLVHCGDNSTIAALLLESLATMTGSIDSLWFNPDRHGCNNLIKALRRARNAEFGADE